MNSAKFPPCPECGWNGFGFHECDPEGARIGNAYAFENLFSKKILWLLVSVFLLPILLITASGLNLGASSSDSNEDSDVTDVPISTARSLTDEELAAGWYYDDSMDFGYKWLTAKEDRKHSCAGNCIVVKVVALTDCKFVRAAGEIFNSGKDNAKSVATSAGWAGGKKSKSRMSANQVKYITLKSTKRISYRQHWFTVTSITCTPTS